LNSSRSRVELFLAHLDSLSGGVEPQFLPIDSTRPGLNGVTAITYVGMPEPDLLTSVTYGVSLAQHAQWRLGKPELTLCVRSSDVTWARAMGWIAEQVRGECPFSYGDILDVGDRISDDSEMSAYVIFAPATMERNDFLNIDVGDDLPIHIAGCYPIHETERQFIREQGLEAFWELDWDPHDVSRPPAVL
jgi:hypothetical protein